MENVAILVDGGFYLKRARMIWGEKSAEDRAEELISHCRAHLWNGPYECKDHLYRIFYYDCPPSSLRPYHPLLKKQIDLAKTGLYSWMTKFQEELRSKRKVALRLGELTTENTYYTLKPDSVKKLFTGTQKLEDMKEEDFLLTIGQKGVDMRIGLDIASMAYKKQVTKMVLISGDSDFVPAAKLARREGIDFVLDPMWAKIKDSLNEHIDGLRSPRPKKDETKGTLHMYCAKSDAVVEE